MELEGALASGSITIKSATVGIAAATFNAGTQKLTVTFGTPTRRASAAVNEGELRGAVLELAKSLVTPAKSSLITVEDIVIADQMRIIEALKPQ